MSAYTINIPHTNPFPLHKIVGGNRVHSPLDDKMSAVTGRRYVQQWALTDRLTFQVSWHGVPLNPSLVTTVRFIVNGTVRKTFAYNFGTTNVQGSLYTCFAVQKKVKGQSVYNGLFGFSQVMGFIKDNSNHTMLADGDCLQITVSDPTGTVWESELMTISSNTAGTKLISYTNTCEAEEMVFDTYFGYMVYGYQIRLHGMLSDVDMATNADFFDTSDGGRLMIRSTPKWTTRFDIGLDGVGLPLYYIRLMTMVMACDSKSLEGFGEFEIADNGFEKEAFADYSNEFYHATITEKANSLSQTSSSTGNKFSIKAALTYKGNETTLQVSVSSYGNGAWHLAPITGLDVTLAQRLGGKDGDTNLNIPLGVLTEDTVIVVDALDATDTLLGSVSLVAKATLKGLGYMAIEDSFMVR